MKKILFLLLTMTATFLSHPAAAAELNTLTPEEKAAGWKLLFDGKSTDGWRTFKKTTFPAKGWVVEDGVLCHPARAGGGDIISDAAFDNFDLQWEWKMSTGGNSGVKYFITEERAQALGHEYQLIDDANHPDAKLAAGKRVTAAFYDVFAPKETKLKPVGEWNQSRVLVKGNHVEHWLNGAKVLEYELSSDEVKAAVAASKFKGVKDFGTRLKGHILLQDHGDEVSFRNLKILDLSGK